MCVLNVSEKTDWSEGKAYHLMQMLHIDGCNHGYGEIVYEEIFQESMRSLFRIHEISCLVV